ncbi:nicotinate (nicotinamide) nucleotide adenylyltransferase [Helicobacter mesocricetorum]|uniref:nicotinate (nicotinamide) nucleotide adenylyltransferase n=1 Tax=Helicobacter mesocricetorum TaxID=87012 RepID=UPI000CF1816C|nr:nicotinate (nicotinamide) nucleotide adenylyltransferase [Helicobacter mesocricetorum]
MGDIAIFGGSFDPPHLGHLEIIRVALEKLTIQKLFVVPCFLNPFKISSYFSPIERLNWLNNLLGGKDSRLEVLDFEIRQNKSTPTFKTIKFVEKFYKPHKIYLLLGADNIETLPKWYQYANLKNKVEFVIIPRKGYEIVGDFKVLPMQEIAISSTQIKIALQKGDLKLLEFVPQAILEEILKRKEIARS